jgi:ammonium transporter, Amt family
MVGMLMTGLFATQAVNGAGANGLIYGNAGFFFTQLKALGIVVAYSFVVSFLIFKFVNLVTPIRVSSEEEELGLDATQHNEKYLQGTLLVHDEKTSGEKTIMVVDGGKLEESLME